MIMEYRPGDAVLYDADDEGVYKGEILDPVTEIVGKKDSLPITEAQGRALRIIDIIHGAHMRRAERDAEAAQAFSGYFMPDGTPTDRGKEWLSENYHIDPQNFRESPMA